MYAVDVMMQGNEVVLFQPGSEFLPMMEKVWFEQTSQQTNKLTNRRLCTVILCSKEGPPTSGVVTDHACRLQVCKILIEKSRDIEGATVENNKFCVTVHFRRVSDEVIRISVTGKASFGRT